MTRPILHRQTSSRAHPSDRAATPSEPSQSNVVSGVAGIPCAFTPGPWRVAGKSTINAERGWVASVSQFNRTENARLIAAAPDLYEACRLFEVAANMSVFDDDANAALAKAHEAAEEALAKARGQ